MSNLLIPVLLALSAQTSNISTQSSSTVTLDATSFVVFDAGSTVTVSSSSSSLQNAPSSRMDVDSTSAPFVSSTSIVLPSSDNPENAFNLINMLIKAMRERNFTLAYGILLMIIVLLLRNFVLPKISSDDQFKKWLPVVSALVATIPAVATKLSSPNVGTDEVITATLTIILVSIGSWEFIGKPVKKMMSSDSVKPSNDTSVQAEEKKES